MSFLSHNKKIELNNMMNTSCNIESMNFTKLTKTELLSKCEELGITKCKSKNKSELINLINLMNVEKKVDLIESDHDKDFNSNIDLSKLSKTELLEKCQELGITKCKSKNKSELIKLINVEIHLEKKIELVVEDELFLENEDEDEDKDNNEDENENNNLFKLDNFIINNDVEKINEDNKIINSNLKYIDLFCGIGGFHQALNKIGAQCILACDIDKDCRTVYKDNYGIEPISNVKDIDEKTMSDFDILCAGFPCQSFSNGGNKKCFEDERGLLFDEIMRIAKEKQPKFMFLENVKHILKVSKGEVIEYIKDKIIQTGYTLQLFQISPHEYGIPQQRERVYFVCVRNDIYNGTDIQLSSFIGTYDFKKILDDKNDINEKYFIKGDILNMLEAWDEIINKFEVGEKISPTILINDAYRNYTEEEFNNFPDWKKDYMTKNRPLIEKYSSQFELWYNIHSELLQKREIYGKLEWQTGPIKENDSIFNHFIQIRQSGIRVKKSQYFPTLVAISQIPIYGKEKRYITPRECARLQSFPETFKLSKDDKKSYKQLGNSVNVDNVFTVINSTLNNYSSCI
jgi:DNA (cytosine-5)-methyltransferase 1